MPILRYIVWVGASLLALLFVASWFLPEPPQEAVHEAIEKPVIRIASVQRHRLRIHRYRSADDLPATIPLESAISDVPPPLQAYASVDPPPVTATLTERSQRTSKGRKQGSRLSVSVSAHFRRCQWGPSSTCSADQTILSKYCLRSGKNCSTCVESGFSKRSSWKRPVSSPMMHA